MGARKSQRWAPIQATRTIDGKQLLSLSANGGQPGTRVLLLVQNALLRFHQLNCLFPDTEAKSQCAHHSQPSPSKVVDMAKRANFGEKAREWSRRGNRCGGSEEEDTGWWWSKSGVAIRELL